MSERLMLMLGVSINRWRRRRDLIVEELPGESIVPAAGGWSMLLDAGKMGLDSTTASNMLLERGKIAATPMLYWGEANGDRFVRLAFNNEPASRLAGIVERVRAGLKG